jgi:hypothetical protein
MRIKMTSKPYQPNYFTEDFFEEPTEYAYEESYNELEDDCEI